MNRFALNLEYVELLGTGMTAHANPGGAVTTWVV